MFAALFRTAQKLKFKFGLTQTEGEVMKQVFIFGYFVLASIVSVIACAGEPGNFFEVSPGIYRSAQPAKADFQDLKALGIKTIMDLNNDENTLSMESKAAKKAGLNFISHPMSGFWSPEEAQVNSSLEILKDPNNLPILVHCKKGQDRTGLIVGLHRVYADGWTPEKAYTEMLDMGFHKSLVPLDDYFKEVTGLDD